MGAACCRVFAVSPVCTLPCGKHIAASMPHAKYWSYSLVRGKLCNGRSGPLSPLPCPLVMDQGVAWNKSLMAMHACMGLLLRGN